MIKLFNIRIMTKNEYKVEKHAAWYQGYCDYLVNSPICTTQCRVAKCLKARPVKIKVKKAVVK